MKTDALLNFSTFISSALQATRWGFLSSHQIYLSGINKFCVRLRHSIFHVFIHFGRASPISPSPKIIENCRKINMQCVPCKKITLKLSKYQMGFLLPTLCASCCDDGNLHSSSFSFWAKFSSVSSSSCLWQILYCLVSS